MGFGLKDSTCGCPGLGRSLEHRRNWKRANIMGEQ